MKITPLLCAGAAALVGLTASCASRTKTVYTPSQAGVIMKEKTGQVVSVRDVVIKEPDRGSIFSTGGPGARIGGVVGRTAATGGSVGTAAAGIIGEEVGRAVGGQFDEIPAEEISIKLDNDELITIVQVRSNPPLAPGERIKVLMPSSSIGTYPGGFPSIGSILSRGATGGGVRVVRDLDPNFVREAQVAASRFAR